MGSATRSWHCLGVPIDCTAQPGGTELAPNVLRQQGLGTSGRFVDLGDTETQLRTPSRDPYSGVVASEDVVSLTAELRERLALRPDPGTRLLVLGGCCTLLPGVLAGLREGGDDVALVYLDGHIDLYDGRTSPTGEAADMPLAVILGFGPQSWVEAAGGRGNLQPGEVTVLGPRDEEDARAHGSVLPADIEGLRRFRLHLIDSQEPGQSDDHTAAGCRLTINASRVMRPRGCGKSGRWPKSSLSPFLSVVCFGRFSRAGSVGK